MNTKRIKTVNRRKFLTGSAAVLAALAASSCTKTGTSARQSLASQKGFKIGACDWTLGKRANPESFEVARQLGLDGVQLSVGTGDQDMLLLKPENQERFRQAAARNNVEIASLGLASLNKVPYKSEPIAEKWVDQSIDVCRSMNTTVILLAFFGEADLRNDPRGTDTVVERLKKVAPKAEDNNVILGIESWLSAEEDVEIIDRVGSPAVQVYYDIGNSDKAGYDIYSEIPYLGNSRICEFHAKDYQDLYGKGSIDFPRVRKAMDDIGYRGWIHIEGTQFPLGRLQSIKYDAQYLKKVFPPT